jgi:hypothetical protein
MKPPLAQPMSRAENAFRWVLMLSTAFGFGAVLGTLPLAERGPAGIQWRLHWASLPLFAIGMAAGIWFWRLVYRLGSTTDKALAHKRLKLGAFAVIPLGIIGFLYPLRFVEPARRTEVFIGLGLAIAVLSVVGVVLVGLIRWLNENEPPDGQP